MRPLRRPLAKAAFFFAAAPLALAAARRVARLEPGAPVDRLVAELRGMRHRPLPDRLARPLWLAGTVELLLPILPPRALGPCLRRALIVVELWSRCGLAPSLHVGLRPAPELGEAHAWVTARGAGGDELRASAPADYVEAFVF